MAIRVYNDFIKHITEEECTRAEETAIGDNFSETQVRLQKIKNSAQIHEPCAHKVNKHV